MRTRIILAVALALAVATPAYAGQRPEPLNARQGIEVGRAAATNSLNGIYVSPYDGNVYVASVGGDEITVHDPRSGRLLDRIGPERGVGGPDDVFITSDGTIYWTEILTGFVGMLGMGLTILGALGLLLQRLTDDDLKPYTTFSHIFNLLFIIVAVGLALAAVVFTNPHLEYFRIYLAGLIVFDLSAVTGSPLHTAAILAVSLLIAYIPLTHMSHFFVKWFTWHKIRWDDEPNVKSGRFDVMIQQALEQPVSWSAEHLNNPDGKKTWADIATEEIAKK